MNVERLIKHIDFVIMPNRNDLYIQIMLDGQDFGQEVRRVSGCDTTDCVLPPSGGDFDLHDTVLRDAMACGGRRSAILLACGCGQAMCGCVVTDVELTNGLVSWDNVRKPHPEGPQRIAVGRVSMRRAGFEQARADLLRRMHEWCRERGVEPDWITGIRRASEQARETGKLEWWEAR